jgi:Flp pilus assembly protein TadD
MSTRKKRERTRAIDTPAATVTPFKRIPAWLALAAVVIAVVACYANALHGPLVFDDRAAVEENPTIRRLDNLAAVLRPPAETPLGGRPLVNLTFAANFASSGLAVESYHLVNIALHLLTAMMLLGVLRRTFARTSITGLSKTTLDAAALVATLLWAVHPLNTESVNYVSQRTELMVSLFYLLALYAAIRAADRPGVWWLGVTALSAMLAAACKESAVTLPLVLVLWDRIFPRGLKPRPTGRWKVYVAAATSWVIFALLAGQASASRRVTGNDASRWTYLLNQAEVIPRYLRRAVWPSGLIFDYGTMPSITVSEVVPGLLLLVALFALTLWLFIRRPHLGFWGAWFWITLAPASSLIPIATEVGAERRMYLPLIGLICLATLSGTALLFRLLSNERARRIAAWATCGGLLIALSATTAARNAEYRSGLRLWETVLERRPGARAHEHLSMFLRDAGRKDEAISELRLATAGGRPEAGHALAAALLERGDLTEALDEFEKFVRANPDDLHIALARREYATALRRAGRLNDAVTQLRSAVVNDPNDVRSYVELGDALRDAGDRANAILVYQDAERLQPNNVVILSNLGVLLATEQGRGAEALRALRAAVAIDPRLTGLRLQIVQLLIVDERYAEAEAEARMLTTAAPSNAEAHNLLGVALVNQGHLEPARVEFARAVALKPGYVDAQRNLARIESMLPRRPR